MINEIKKFFNINQQEAEKIYNFYEIEKDRCQNITLQFREQIIGVGIIGEHLRFYFVKKENSIFIKFKTKKDLIGLNEITREKFEEIVNDINYLFNSNPLLFTNKVNKIKTKQINYSRFKILEGFANGINILTGEKLFNPDDETKILLINLAFFTLKKEGFDKNKFTILINEDDVYNKIENLKEQQTLKKQSNIGKRWSVEEDDKLKQEYNNLTLEEIAKIHARKVGGIRERLKKLGLMDEMGNLIEIIS